MRCACKVAQHLLRSSMHLREAHLEVAEEALEHARGLNDDRLLAATLQRCARVYKPSEIGHARRRFAQSVDIYRSLDRDEETARALVWWANAEADAGEFKTAVSISEQALGLASDDLKPFLAEQSCESLRRPCERPCSQAHRSRCATTRARTKTPDRPSRRR